MDPREVAPPRWGGKLKRQRAQVWLTAHGVGGGRCWHVRVLVHAARSGPRPSSRSPSVFSQLKLCFGKCELCARLRQAPVNR